MPKVIESPVKKFPGTVTLFDPLTMPQVVVIDECLVARGVFFEEKEIDGKRAYVLKADAFWSGPDTAALKAIFECVDEWNLNGIPEDVTTETFPGSPRNASRELVNWLIKEILDIYRGETEIPNE